MSAASEAESDPKASGRPLRRAENVAIAFALSGIVVNWQTGAAAFAGRWRKAEELSRRAIDLAARGDTKEVAVRFATE